MSGRQALAGLVNELIAQVEPDRAVTFTDRAAGRASSWRRCWPPGRGGC